MIALVVFTDGRDCLTDTLESLAVHLTGTITRRLLINDDPHTSVDLEGWECHNAPTRRGFAGTIGYAWTVLASIPEEYIAHWEDDFVLTDAVDLDDLCGLLARHPDLDQVALLRQPWNETERAAGGIIECHPEAFTEHCDDSGVWIEHAQFFTTNPSVYRRDLVANGWPQTRHSEGIFTAQRRAAGRRFAYWGPRDHGPWVEHIGTERAGTGY